MRDGRSAILNDLLGAAIRITALMTPVPYSSCQAFVLVYCTVRYVSNFFVLGHVYFRLKMTGTIFPVLYSSFITYGQCSGSVGSVCFWVSWIRIPDPYYLYGCGSGSYYQQKAKKWRKPWFLLLRDFKMTCYLCDLKCWLVFFLGLVVLGSRSWILKNPNIAICGKKIDFCQLKIWFNFLLPKSWIRIRFRIHKKALMRIWILLFIDPQGCQ